MLRQAENTVTVQGILAELDLDYNTYRGKNGQPVESIRGKIKVLVEQPGKPSLEIPVYCFANKYITGTNTVTTSFANLEMAMKELKSIAACGSKEQADKVRIGQASMVMNEYYRNGVFRREPRISGRYISRVTNNFKPEASFFLEFAVSKIYRVCDSDGHELNPPKAEIEAIVPQYGGKVDVFTLTASNPDVISVIESCWQSGKTYTAGGRLHFSSEVHTEEIPVDFGEPIVRQSTRTLHELEITRGTQVAQDGDFAFDETELQTAIAERAARLEASKTQGEKLKSTPFQSGSSTSISDIGF